MGYMTYYGVSVIGGSADEQNAIFKEISKAVYGDENGASDIETGFEAKWYDCEDDVTTISRRHPDIIIEVTGDGESSEDIWAERFRGGDTETLRFDGLPDFKTILAPGEEEKAYDAAGRAYRKALEALRSTAIQRIRQLKDSITKEPDRHLSIELLNDSGPELVVAGTLPLSHREYVPLMVGGIHDDGDVLWTERDPVCVADMLPEDLFNLVATLEGFVRDIERGIIKGRWCEEEEWYELYYAGRQDG